MSPESGDVMEPECPDQSDTHKLLVAEGKVLAKAREVARRITERVWRALGYTPPESPPESNPPALA